MTKAVLEAESEDRRQKGMRELPPNYRSDLRDLLRRAESVKPRHQRCLQACRDCRCRRRNCGGGSTRFVVARKLEADLAASLDRLIQSGLLFRQGARPHANYLFKHALVQDAAYGTLLREPRRALHAWIAETIESQFAEIAENQPELLARHCTEAGLIEKAASLWGKAGQRSLPFGGC